MISLSAEALEQYPLLQDTVVCPRCGKEHKILYGVPDDLTDSTDSSVAYYKCQGEPYLAGILGYLLS